MSLGLNDKTVRLLAQLVEQEHINLLHNQLRSCCLN